LPKSVLVLEPLNSSHQIATRFLIDVSETTQITLTVDILVFDSDLDECSEGRLCDGKCLNTVGSYRCLCEPGYRQHEGRCIGKCYAQAEKAGSCVESGKQFDFLGSIGMLRSFKKIMCKSLLPQNLDSDAFTLSVTGEGSRSFLKKSKK
jgi:hypothetical protein